MSSSHLNVEGRKWIYSRPFAVAFFLAVFALEVGLVFELVR